MVLFINMEQVHTFQAPFFFNDVEPHQGKALWTTLGEKTMDTWPHPLEPCIR